MAGSETGTELYRCVPLGNCELLARFREPIYAVDYVQRSCQR